MLLNQDKTLHFHCIYDLQLTVTKILQSTPPLPRIALVPLKVLNCSMKRALSLKTSRLMMTCFARCSWASYVRWIVDVCTTLRIQVLFSVLMKSLSLCKINRKILITNPCITVHFQDDLWLHSQMSKFTPPSGCMFISEGYNLVPYKYSGSTVV